MLKKSWLLIFISIALVLGIVGIVKLVVGGGTWTCKEGEWVKQGKPLTSKPQTPCLAAGKGIANENLPNIIISSPKAYSEVGLPLSISGKARVFENTFNFKLVDMDGSTLVEGIANSISNEAGKYGDFSIYASYPKPKGQTGILEVFDYSAKDGNVIDKISLPIKFKDVDSMTIKVFLKKSNINSGSSCDTVFPVERRVERVEGVAKASLEELLKGPYTNESSEGFSTSINSGVKLNSVKIEKAVVYADFDNRLDANVTDLCNAQTIIAQINETLKQFSTVDSVVISIDGRSAGILQP